MNAFKLLRAPVKSRLRLGHASKRARNDVADGRGLRRHRAEHEKAHYPVEIDERFHLPDVQTEPVAKEGYSPGSGAHLLGERDGLEQPRHQKPACMRIWAGLPHDGFRERRAIAIGARHILVFRVPHLSIEHHLKVQRASWKRSKRCNASSIRFLRNRRARSPTQVHRCTSSFCRSRSVLRSTTAAISSPTSTGWAK